MPTAMVYLRQPNLQKALAAINSLIAEEPNNPYFYEVRGPDLYEHGQAGAGHSRLPEVGGLAPAGAAAETGTGHRPACHRGSRAWRSPRLPTSRRRSWSRMTTSSPGTRPRRPTARSRMSRWPISPPPKLWYNVGDMRKALVFATRARGKLPQGSADWQRAGDIIGAAAPLAAQQTGMKMRARFCRHAGGRRWRRRRSRSPSSLSWRRTGWCRSTTGRCRPI